MAINPGPVEGNWYEIIETGECFSVVTVDEEEGMLEIQYEDGGTEELELQEWEEMDLEPIDPPLEYPDSLEEMDELDEESHQREEAEEEWGESAMPDLEE